jgi:hypothetical protein
VDRLLLRLRTRSADGRAQGPAVEAIAGSPTD